MAPAKPDRVASSSRRRQPVLKTERLLLRPFELRDAPRVQELAGDRQVADTTLNIPNPYADGLAESWIAAHQDQFNKGIQVTLAITLRETGVLIGAISLSSISRQHERAELGYWVGVPWWNQDYCTEAVQAVLEYGFRTLGLNRIHASHFRGNPSSGRVMQKVGMKPEGCLRQHVRKTGRFEDLVLYSILRSEFASQA